MHWTRGPSNVPRRTRLTPRNLRDRSLRRPKPPGSRSPTTSEFNIQRAKSEDQSPRTSIQRPAAPAAGNAGPWRLIFGLVSKDQHSKACCSSGRVSVEPLPKGKRTVTALPRGPFHPMPRNPKVRRTDFPVQPIQTHPRVNPLDALISMPAWTCLRDKPRRINSKAALTDRTVPPKGFPIPGASRPKAPRPGCRTSNPPEGWPSIRRTHGRSTYPKTRKPL